MRRDSPGSALAWMATGAAMVAMGALVGSSNRRKPAISARGAAGGSFDKLGEPAGAGDDLEENATGSGLTESLVGVVARLEARVQSLEDLPSGERVEAIWLRLLQLEHRVEEIRNQRFAIPSADALISQTEHRLAPRLQRIETRMEEHQGAIHQLQAQAHQTDLNLQKMIGAVEKLTDQISRVLPGTVARLQSRESPNASSGPASGHVSGSEREGRQAEREPVAPQGLPSDRENTLPFRLKSLAL